MNEKIRNRVAFHLLETRDVKLSPSMIDAFVSFAEAKAFVPSDSLIKIREDVRNISIPGKIDYVLTDGSVVAITPQLNEVINKEMGLADSESIKKITSSVSSFVEFAEKITSRK